MLPIQTAHRARVPLPGTSALHLNKTRMRTMAPEASDDLLEGDHLDCECRGETAHVGCDTSICAEASDKISVATMWRVYSVRTL